MMSYSLSSFVKEACVKYFDSFLVPSNSNNESTTFGQEPVWIGNIPRPGLMGPMPGCAGTRPPGLGTAPHTMSLETNLELEPKNEERQNECRTNADEMQTNINNVRFAFFCLVFVQIS